MGNANAKTVTTNANNQTYVTENDIEMLNQLTNTAVANTLIKNKASCTKSSQRKKKKRTYHGVCRLYLRKTKKTSRRTI